MQNLVKKLSMLVVGVSLSSGLSWADGLSCRHGLSWTISQNPAWGFGRPVVTRVLPYSAAEEAGFKAGDIIERIDGYATERLSPEQIIVLLQSTSKLHTLQTSNLNALHKKHILAYHCKPSGSLSERELAELFSLYSTEDASLEYVTYPYNYSYSTSFPLLSLQTYAFARPSFAGEDQLNELIDEALKAKGLTPSAASDIVISTRYRIDTLDTDNDREVTGSVMAYDMSWRYDARAKELKPYPIYSQDKVGVSAAKYLMTLEVRMQSRQSREIIWRCEAKDYLSEYLSVEDYAEQAIPTMLIGFPYAMQMNAPRLALRTLRYNYTGIIYDQRRLNKIIDIEDASPAMKAGLRPSDVILSINGLPIEGITPDEYLAQYFRTAEKLDRYRDRNLPALRSLVSQIPVSYWLVGRYNDIASVLGQAKSAAAFSYLFGFRAYTPAKEGKAIIYEVQRNRETYYVPIIPERRNESIAYPY